MFLEKKSSLRQENSYIKMFFGTSDSETTKDKWLQFVLTNVIPLLISKDDHLQKNEFIFYLHLDYWQSEIRF